MGGRTDLEQLVYQMSTDIRQLERQNTRALAVVNGTAGKIENRYKALGKVDVGKFLDKTFDRSRLAVFEAGAARVPIFGAALEALGPAGMAAAAGVAAVAVATTVALGAMKFADEIDDTSTRLNVGAEALQEYRFALTEVGGEAKDADSAIEGFQKKLGEGIAGGKALKWFARLGFGGEDLKAFDSTEQALDAVLDRISKLGRESERAAVAEKLGLGPMVALAREGAGRLAALRQEARDLGIVMDAELVRRGAEANQEFETMSKIIDMQLKSAFIDLAPAIVKAIGLVADLATELARAMDQWRDLDHKTGQGLQRERAAMQAEKDAIANRFGTRPLNGQVIVGRQIEGGQYSRLDPNAVRRAAGPNPFNPRAPVMPSGSNENWGLLEHRDHRAFLDAGEQFDAATRRISAIDEQLAARNSRLPSGNGPGAELADVGGAPRSRRASGPSAAEIARRRQELEQTLAIEIARLNGNTELVGVLEREKDIQQRIRDYVASNLSETDARTKALEDQARLDLAREAANQRELHDLETQHGIEYERLLGNDRYVANLERTLALQAQTEQFERLGLDHASALNLAKQNLLEIDRARAEVQARLVADAALEHQLTLARVRGDEVNVRRMERAQQIDRRAREIESRTGLNRGEGEAQATREVDEEIAAQSRAGFKSGVRGLLEDLRSGGLEGVLRGIWERSTDKMLDNLAEVITLIVERLRGANGGGGAGGGDWMSQAANAVFSVLGKREGGGPVSAGRPYVVGEKRPELFVPGVSGTIIPSLQAASRSPMPSRGGLTQIFQVNAQGAVMAEGLVAELRAAGAAQAAQFSGEAYQRARVDTAADLTQRRRYGR